MRTSSLLVLSLVLAAAYVSSAPVEKPLEVAKRDQEILMFGNQQNNNKVKRKKSDPAVPLLADDNVDRQGYIEAAPANPEIIAQLKAEEPQSSMTEMVESVVPPIKQQLPENSEESSKSPQPEADTEEETDSVEEELKGVMAASAQQEEEEQEAPVAVNEAAEEVEEVPAEEVVEESQENEVPEESEEEEQSSEEEASVDAPRQPEEEVEMTEEIPDNADIQRILDSLEYYYMKQRPQESREDYYRLMYPDFRYKRSTRNTRAVTEGGMERNELKRSKRIKRDLFEDEDGLYYDPYGAETYEPDESDDELYGLYQVDPKYEDEVATLLDMYEQAPEDEPYQAYEPYEQVPVDEIYPELYEELQEEEEPVYVPSKRQMMSSLPGIKKRYFYPYSIEPKTHWGAFVRNEKRDYDEAYRRLLALASALSEDSPYYQAYKKK